jgi:site-specific DNA-adenine methylase
MQFRVSFDVSRNKIKIDVISRSGAPKPYPNIYLNQDLFADTMKDSGHTRMRIFFDPEYYDVFKTRTYTTYRNKKPVVRKNTQFLDLLSDKYKIQIINVDSQMSKVIDISINDDSGEMLEIPMTNSTLLTIS